SEAEDDAVLVAQADVEGEVLRGERATVPRATDRDDGADERRAFARSVLEVEEERRAAVPAAVAVADKDRRTPLRALQRARLLAEAVAELTECRAASRRSTSRRVCARPPPPTASCSPTFAQTLTRSARAAAFETSPSASACDATSRCCAR